MDTVMAVIMARDLPMLNLKLMLQLMLTMVIMAEDTDMVIPDIMAMDMADGGAKDPLMPNPKPMLTQLLMPTMVIMAVDTVTVMDSATADGGARGPLMPNLKPKPMPGTADTMVDTDMVVITAVLTDTDMVVITA